MFTITGLLAMSMSECLMDQGSLHNAHFLEGFFLFLPPILKFLVLWGLGLINCCIDSTLCLPSLRLSLHVDVYGCISWQHASLVPYYCRFIHLCPWISMLVYFLMRFTGAGVSVLFHRSGFFQSALFLLLKWRVFLPCLGERGMYLPESLLQYILESNLWPCPSSFSAEGEN